MKFRYKAQTKAGEIIKGEAEADDKFALAHQMKEQGSFLISAEAADEVGGIDKINSYLAVLSGKIKIEDIIVFIRSLGAMIEAGLPLLRALAVLKRQTQNPRFKTIIEDISQEITKGSELSVALNRYPAVFSPLTVAMLEAGEKSGNLAQSLGTISEQIEQNHLLYKRVRGAMIYPAIIIMTMIVVGILMLMFVVPSLTATFVELGVELPFATKVLITVSDFLRNNTFFFIGGLIAFGFLFRYMIKTPRGKRLLEALILKIPLIGQIAKQVNSARTTRTLSSLLSSGVDMIDALAITENVLQNGGYKKILKEAREKIQKGVALSEVFKKHETLYPVLVGEMVSVGEETGKLSEMLMNVTKFYENEVAQVTKDLSTVIEPILMVVIGAGVGFFAYSMITPLYTVLGGI